MRIIFLTLFVIFCIFWYLRFKTISETKLKPNTNYSISGVISSESAISDTSQTIKLGNFRIRTVRLPRYSIGDRIEITGKVEERAINKFYRQFWFIYPEIRVLSSGFSEKNNRTSLFLGFLRVVSDFRRRLEKNFFRILPPPQVNLLSGIVLGSKTSLSPEFYNNLRQSGTLHIVVASGANIVISAKIILDIFVKRFRRGLVIFIIVVYILIYTILTGFEPPIIRASIMAFLVFSAQLLGRAYWGGLALFLTAGVMLLFNPLLIFEVGFQLSAAATAGLIFIGPQVKNWLERVLQRFQQGPSLQVARTVLAMAKSDLTETFSAQLAVLPILLFTFGEFNFLSVLPNILIGFLVPFLMRYGLLYILIGLVIFPLAKLLGFILWVPLSYMVMVINFFGKIDWLTLEMNLPWWTGLFYWGGLYFVFSRRYPGPDVHREKDPL